MGSDGGRSRPVMVRVLDSSLSEANRTGAVCGKLPFTCRAPAHYNDTDTCLKDLTQQITDVLIVDLETLASDDGLEQFAVRCPTAVIIAVSARGSVSRAVTAMRAGAHDFLTKPFSLDTLGQKICAQLDMRPLMPADENDPQNPASEAEGPAPHTEAFATGGIGKTDQSQTGLARLIGRSAPMQHIAEQIERMAPSQAPVFITGESGTGKELCANAIHDLSERRNKPFITLNCAAIPRDLIESEIFGYVRGAFTGATDNRTGAAELADGGTLFLDEIGEMDLMLQSKLLRFLQTGTFQRLGDAKPVSVDARIICATNRNPLQEIAAGRFREDLYYRLHVLPVHLPPLRDRREDIIPLATTFLRTYAGEEGRAFCGFDADAKACLTAYSWPGNVRQLENTIRQIVVMNDGQSITLDMLPMLIRDPSGRTQGIVDLSRERAKPQANIRAFGSIEPLWEQERRIIETALDAFNGNIAMAAAALEISPSTIYRKRQSWTGRTA
ncbi:sigma-54-dependent Fis family transcriptional regulator [Roseibium aquae]|uniref:Sigma-54-dependent Fis family transcriptional regulator n=1 Tax=Roseibium aquae TaxID=1323746 RepID=A0A916TL19_9HYPH|nr:sigma-54 dependent transcriptional regulator [Roseibium aquae]GGB52643.1 sigma-54-dependent Fis family transcriptional regulator [Roseibium aquae]